MRAVGLGRAIDPTRLARRAAAAVVVLVAAGGVGVGAASTTPAVRPVVLPRDQGAHPGFNVEWWYTAGTVADASDRHYFWFATIWSNGSAEVAKVNVVDLHADRIVLSREYLSATPVSTDQTQLAVGGLRLGFTPAGRWGRWLVDAPTDHGGLLRLTLLPRQPYVAHGRGGIIEQGPAGPSAYYSEPRLAASGTLELAGRKLRVSGLGWLDHQWGNFGSDAAALRWNWFACQFRDGSDLMLYQFLGHNARPTKYQDGTLVTRGGKVAHLVHFTVVPLSPRIQPAGARATYPLRWRLEVPAGSIDITLRSKARHQFIMNTIVPSFWEGASAITRGRPGQCIVESSREIGGPS